MSEQSDHANAIRLLKALIARGANSKEPIADAYIAQIALEIGLGGDELNSALAYAGSQKWIEDSKMTGRTSLTRAGEGAAESGQFERVSADVSLTSMREGRMNDTMFGYWVTTLGVFLVTVCTLIAVWTLAETVSMTALLVRLRGERTIRPGDYGLRRFRYVSA